MNERSGNIYRWGITTVWLKECLIWKEKEI